MKVPLVSTELFHRHQSKIEILTIKAKNMIFVKRNYCSDKRLTPSVLVLSLKLNLL